MTITILPRLPLGTARELVAVRWRLTVEEARSQSAAAHPRQLYASNGDRISSDAILRLVDELRQCARAYGYPAVEPSDTAARAWDGAATTIMWSHLADLVPAEAGRSDVWAFLTVVACPDLVIWRYPIRVKDEMPSGIEARFLGGRRNMLKRFWQRARALSVVGAGWSVLNSVREDDLVQIFERHSLAAVPAFPGTFIQLIASLSETVSVRDVLKRLNRELAVTAMYMLTSEELNRLIHSSLKTSQHARLRSGTQMR